MANHAHYGVLTARDREQPGVGMIDDLNIFDVAPMILAAMDIPIPEDMQGRPILFVGG